MYRRCPPPPVPQVSNTSPLQCRGKGKSQRHWRPLRHRAARNAPRLHRRQLLPSPSPHQRLGVPLLQRLPQQQLLQHTGPGPLPVHLVIHQDRAA